MKNPVTDQEYDNERAFVESIIDSYEANRIAAHNITVDENLLIQTLVDIIGETAESSTTLQGQSKEVIVKKRVNVSYPKDRSEEHPLRKLLREHGSLLSEMIRVDYKESGAKIQKFMDRIIAKGGDPEEVSLFNELTEHRVKNIGKPELKIGVING